MEEKNNYLSRFICHFPRKHFIDVAHGNNQNNNTSKLTSESKLYGRIQIYYKVGQAKLATITQLLGQSICWKYVEFNYLQISFIEYYHNYISPLFITHSVLLSWCWPINKFVTITLRDIDIDKIYRYRDR